MPDGRRRSREGWADAMEDGPANPPAHTHRLPPVVRIAIVGLAAAVFLLLVAVGLLSTYVYQQQQYVQGRGEQRDQENARLEEMQRQGICDLLDQLPEGGLLERPRDKYGCGPGIPLDQLTPQEQAQLGGRTQPQFVPPTSSAVVPAPPLGSSATDVPPPPATTLPPRTGPGLEPSPAPDPLGPITDPLCDLADVCL